MNHRFNANILVRIAEWLTFAVLLFYGFRRNHPGATYGALFVIALTIGHNG